MSKHAAKQLPKQEPARFGRFGEVIAELRKVVWLPKQEAAYLTGMVLLVTAIFGAMLGGLDFGFAEAVSKLLLGG